MYHSPGRRGGWVWGGAGHTRRPKKPIGKRMKKGSSPSLACPRCVVVARTRQGHTQTLAPAPRTPPAARTPSVAPACVDVAQERRARARQAAPTPCSHLGDLEDVAARARVCVGLQLVAPLHVLDLNLLVGHGWVERGLGEGGGVCASEKRGGKKGREEPPVWGRRKTLEWGRDGRARGRQSRKKKNGVPRPHRIAATHARSPRPGTPLGPSPLSLARASPAPNGRLERTE